MIILQGRGMSRTGMLNALAPALWTADAERFDRPCVPEALPNAQHTVSEQKLCATGADQYRCRRGGLIFFGGATVQVWSRLYFVTAATASTRSKWHVRFVARLRVGHRIQTDAPHADTDLRPWAHAISTQTHDVCDVCHRLCLAFVV